MTSKVTLSSETKYQLQPDFTGCIYFMTALYGELNLGDYTFTFTNCGYLPIFARRANGQVKHHKAGGPTLSIFHGLEFETSSMFGLQRLDHHFSGQNAAPSQEILEGIIRSANDFCQADFSTDGVRLVVISHTSTAAHHPLVVEA